MDLEQLASVHLHHLQRGRQLVVPIFNGRLLGRQLSLVWDLNRTDGPARELRPRHQVLLLLNAADRGVAHLVRDLVEARDLEAVETGAVLEPGCRGVVIVVIGIGCYTLLDLIKILGQLGAVLGSGNADPDMLTAGVARRSRCHLAVLLARGRGLKHHALRHDLALAVHNLEGRRATLRQLSVLARVRDVQTRAIAELALSLLDFDFADGALDAGCHRSTVVAHAAHVAPRGLLEVPRVCRERQAFLPRVDALVPDQLHWLLHSDGLVDLGLLLLHVLLVVTRSLGD